MVSARFAAVTDLPSPRPGLVTSSMCTGVPLSEWTTRVRSARYCSAATASGAIAATSVGARWTIAPLEGAATVCAAAAGTPLDGVAGATAGANGGGTTTGAVVATGAVTVIAGAIGCAGGIGAIAGGGASGAGGFSTGTPGAVAFPLTQARSVP